MYAKCVMMLCVLVLFACNSNSKTEIKEIASAYSIYGDTITPDEVVLPEKMQQEYKKMQVGDTSFVKLKAKVVDVCKAKGCWMKLDMSNGTEALVKFENYSFFVPKDIEGKEVIVKGKAFLNEMPVDERRHYAEDAGKNKEEIATITEPLITYSFEAEGVLIPKKENQ